VVARSSARTPARDGFAVALLAFVIAGARAVTTTDAAQGLLGAALAAVSAGLAFAGFSALRSALRARR
jgi:hypothetical protein